MRLLNAIVFSMWFHRLNWFCNRLLIIGMFEQFSPREGQLEHIIFSVTRQAMPMPPTMIIYQLRHKMVHDAIYIPLSLITMLFSNALALLAYS